MWKWRSLSRVWLFVTPWTIQPWNSPGQNTGMCSISLLLGIFQTQESNWGLLHCSQILYQLSHKGSPGMLEWVAYPFFSRSFRPRNQIGVSCIAGEFFTSWAAEVVWHCRDWGIVAICPGETEYFFIDIFLKFPAHDGNKNQSYFCYFWNLCRQSTPLLPQLWWVPGSTLGPSSVLCCFLKQFAILTA